MTKKNANFSHTFLIFQLSIGHRIEKMAYSCWYFEWHCHGYWNIGAAALWTPYNVYFVCHNFDEGDRGCCWRRNTVRIDTTSCSARKFGRCLIKRQFPRNGCQFNCFICRTISFKCYHDSFVRTNWDILSHIWSLMFTFSFQSFDVNLLL